MKEFKKTFAVGDEYDIAIYGYCYNCEFMFLLNEEERIHECPRCGKLNKIL
jgi:hypothetical protein